MDNKRKKKQYDAQEDADDYFEAEDINEQIRKKAYELYEKRGGTQGSDWEDWFEAEKIIGDRIRAFKKGKIKKFRP